MPVNAASSFSISELAQEFDVTTRTIRFYEEKGLLSPERNGSSRVYSKGERVKLKLILRGKRLGLTLEQSRDIISMYDPKHGNAEQLKKLIRAIKEQRERLEQQRQDIDRMLADLQHSEKSCLKALKQNSE